MSEETPQRETLKIGFLGPVGSFADMALREAEGVGEYQAVPFPTMREAILAADQGLVDAAFVAIENSIEGTVNISLDTLIFETDLQIVQEHIFDIQLSLLAPRGVKLKDIKRVVSFPVAVAECRSFLSTKAGNPEVIAANSTSEAARQVSRTSSRVTAAIGTKLSAEIYGLSVIVDDISDHLRNQTRFVLVKSGLVPVASGHDKTSIVVFQADNKAGNLYTYLGQFAARSINLSKLQSRPTKKGLGDYCFVIDMEGHISNEVIADCLRDLHVQAGGLKFLGSYPSAGLEAPRRRRNAVAARRAADNWVQGLRNLVANADGSSDHNLKVVK